MRALGRWCVLAVALSALVGAGCSSGGDDAGGNADVGDGLIGVDAPPSDLGGAAPVEVIGGGGSTDQADPDGSDGGPGGDTTADVPESLCGRLGDPCSEDGQCCSGYCVPGASGYQCSKTCDGDCPQGFECQLLDSGGADAVYLCLDVAAALCQPCKDDDDCNEGQPDAPDLCLSYGDEGSFCGINCGPSGHVCPTGYSCVDVEGAPGGADRQCRRDDSLCECNAVSIQLGASTVCGLTNGNGTCPGTRACGPEGLTACEGTEATPEICNDIDDDCDGVTDEGLGGAACSIANVHGDCPGITACLGGADICDGPTPAAEVCNAFDDDCDGDVDEDTDFQCHPYVCAGLACATSCDSHEDCAADAFCDLADLDGDGDTAECLSKVTDGGACGAPEGYECIGATCSNGYCCSDPEGECCAVDLNCAHLSGAATCDQSDATGCAGSRVVGLCSEAHVCATEVVAELSACVGVACIEPSCDEAGFTPASMCNAAGACVPTGAEQACDGLNPCTVDSCTGAGGCSHVGFDGPSTEACYSANPDLVGIGVCVAGVTSCAAGKAKSCLGEVLPGPELCNGLDDSCDGITDEGGDALCTPYPCHGPSGCGTTCEAQEECAEGWFCDLGDIDKDGNSAECVPLLGAGQACHDGSHFECGPGFCNHGFCCGSEGEDCCNVDANCQHLAHQASCLTATEAACLGSRTDASCSEDNTCETSIVPDATGCDGALCSAGACQPDGDHVEPMYCDDAGECVLGGGLSTCDDGNVCTVDTCDDASGCDTEPINGPSDGACYEYDASTLGKGTCKAGVVTCANGVASGCAQQVGPVNEVCNGLDDDCDAQTDEGGDTLCAPWACAGDAGCTTSCASDADCADDAFCDTEDTDNDGNLAECLPKKVSGAACSDGHHSECAAGWCNNGHCCGSPSGDCCGSIIHCQHLAQDAECQFASQAGCFGVRVDGICGPDNVCDAVEVEDPTGCFDVSCKEGSCLGSFHTAPTRCNAVGACALGGATKECDDGNICTTNACDATTGCSWAPLDGPTAQACYTFEPPWTADVGTCKTGHIGCNAGSPVGCVEQVGPATESCDGFDDDCDGLTDEGADALCPPYACLGEAGCGTSCASHGDCQGGFYCDLDDTNSNGNSAECLPSIDSGDPCAQAYQCDEGTCNNGYCCGSPSGDCCGSDAHCQHLAQVATCDDVSACDGSRVAGFCAAGNVCSTQTVADPSACAGQLCEAPSCSGNVASFGTVCDGSGFCATSVGTMNCAGANTCCSYGCSGGACQGTFNDGNILCSLGCATGIVSCTCY